MPEHTTQRTSAADRSLIARDGRRRCSCRRRVRGACRRGHDGRDGRVAALEDVDDCAVHDGPHDDHDRGRDHDHGAGVHHDRSGDDDVDGGARLHHGRAAASSTTAVAAQGSTLPAPTTTAAPAATLPNTGSNVMPAAIFGACAVAGGVLLLARRRRDVATLPLKKR